MKILVTGANGYIGQGVVKKLLDNGHHVIAADFSENNIDGRASVKTCDIFSLEEPYEFFEQPDVVLHLAWRNGFVHNNSSHIEDLPNHFQFLKRLIDAGVPQLAVLGSMHEIGFHEGSVKDSTPANPLSLYGIGKNALRGAVQYLIREKGLSFQWIRGFYIVGNIESGSSIFSKIAQSESEGKEFFPFTSGQNQWDFIDYENFCDQIVAIVEQKKVTGIINACSGYPEKLADRVERFIRDNHYKIKLKYGEFPDRIYDSKAIWGDDSKIRMIMAERHEWQK